MNKSLIAPCGMNCALCSAYQRDKNHCDGCNSNNIPFTYCQKCIIRNCEHIASSKSKFCYECSKYPCLRLKQLDKRYATKYKMSMLENLQQIEDFGIEKFIAWQKVKWACKECGNTICVHKGHCLKCKEKSMKKLCELPNIGETMEQRLAAVGINDVETFMKLGSKETFIKLRLHEGDTCLSSLCGLQGAIEGIRWHNLSKETKEDLKKFYKTFK